MEMGVPKGVSVGRVTTFLTRFLRRQENGASCQAITWNLSFYDCYAILSFFFLANLVMKTAWIENQIVLGIIFWEAMELKDFLTIKEKIPKNLDMFSTSKQV